MPLAHLLGLEDGVRAHFEGGVEVLATELLVPFDVHLVDERALGDLVGQHPLAVLLVQLGLDVVEEAHAVERADVAVDGLLVEVGAGLRANLDANGLFLDAVVAGDDDAVEPRTFGCGIDARGCLGP